MTTKETICRKIYILSECTVRIYANENKGACRIYSVLKCETQICTHTHTHTHTHTQTHLTFTDMKTHEAYKKYTITIQKSSRDMGKVEQKRHISREVHKICLNVFFFFFELDS